jgi:hypothetical protein
MPWGYTVRIIHSIRLGFRDSNTTFQGIFELENGGGLFGG